MQELEKILEEIDNRVHFYDNADEPMMYVKTVKEIIRKHMNDGWIPVEDRLPEESLNSVIGWDDYRNRCVFVQYYNCRWVLGNGIEPVKIVAWRPLPEPYHPERSENHDGE